MTISWFVDRDPDGSVSRVIRVHREDGALWGEFLRDGVWVQDPVVLDVLTDRSWGAPVTAAAGEEIARSFGADPA
jgi:hypothetical protein